MYEYIFECHGGSEGALVLIFYMTWVQAASQQHSNENSLFQRVIAIPKSNVHKNIVTSIYLWGETNKKIIHLAN